MNVNANELLSNDDSSRTRNNGVKQQFPLNTNSDTIFSKMVSNRGYMIWCTVGFLTMLFMTLFTFNCVCYK